MIFICYGTIFFGDLDFDLLNANFFLTFIKTIDMHTVGRHGQFDTFSRSKKTQSAYTLPTLIIFVCYRKQFLEIQIPTLKILQFFVYVLQYLGYAAGWTSRLVQHIFKVKRAPKWLYLQFRRIACAITYQFFGDPDFYVLKAKIFVDICHDIGYAYWLLAL